MRMTPFFLVFERVDVLYHLCPNLHSPNLNRSRVSPTRYFLRRDASTRWFFVVVGRKTNYGDDATARVDDSTFGSACSNEVFG